MKWLLLAVLGIVLNSLGLCIFGAGVIHHGMAAGAAAAGFGDGLIGLILINAGVWLIAEAVRSRGR